jgi:hypothetical protein
MRKIETAEEKEEATDRRVREMKHMQTIETGRFNKNYFL